MRAVPRRLIFVFLLFLASFTLLQVVFYFLSQAKQQRGTRALPLGVLNAARAESTKPTEAGTRALPLGVLNAARAESTKPSEAPACARDLAELGRPAANTDLESWANLKKRRRRKTPSRGVSGFNRDVWNIVQREGRESTEPSVYERVFGNPPGSESVFGAVGATGDLAIFIEEVHLPVGGVPFISPLETPGNFTICIRSTLRAKGIDISSLHWRVNAEYTHEVGGGQGVLCSVVATSSVSASSLETFVDLDCVLRLPRAGTLLSLMITADDDRRAMPLSSPWVSVSLRIHHDTWRRSRESPAVSAKLNGLMSQKPITISGDWRPDLQCPLQCQRAKTSDSAAPASAHVLSVSGAFRELPTSVKRSRVPIVMVNDECVLHRVYSRFGSSRYLRAISVRWIAGYSRDSQVPNFGNARRAPTPVSELRQHLGSAELRIGQHSRANVVFFSSTCRAVRTQIVEELQKSIAVDSHGRCLNNVGDVSLNYTGPNQHGPRVKSAINTKSEIQARYPFCLAIDNCVLDDYVMQDKLFECFQAGSVPVYFGAPNFRDLLPQDSSAVAMDDFPSIAALARFLEENSSGKKISQFHKWRGDDEALWSPGFRALLREDRESLDCRICRAIALDAFGWQLSDGATRAGLCSDVKYSAVIYR